MGTGKGKGVANVVVVSGQHWASGASVVVAPSEKLAVADCTAHPPKGDQKVSLTSDVPPSLVTGIQEVSDEDISAIHRQIALSSQLQAIINKQTIRAIRQKAWHDSVELHGFKTT